MAALNEQKLLLIILLLTLFQSTYCGCLLPDLDFSNGTVKLPHPLRHVENRTIVAEELSFIQYECSDGFVLIGSESMQCVDDQWTSKVPFCTGFFDTSFTLIKKRWDKITCYTNKTHEVIEFSRLLDTGKGESVPKEAVIKTLNQSTIIDFFDVDYRDNFGVYKCHMKDHSKYMEIVIPWQSASVFSYFPDLTQVANYGDTVELKLHEAFFENPSNLRWRHNEVHVASWDDQRKVVIVDVKPADAGIYECFYEGTRDQPHGLLRLIVRKCEKDLYGDLCDGKCPTCYNGGICHDTLGICVCPPGFTGNNCEFACGKNRYGADCLEECPVTSCFHHIFCKPDPYGCSCAPGYRGTICGDGCRAGWYGADCKQTCHCANGPYSCDKFTGACSGGCSLGWTGQSCQMKGFWDESFILVANSPHSISCYSTENSTNIKFSKVLGLDSARGLPLNSTTRTSKQAAILDFSAVDLRAQAGVYECGLRVHNWSEIILFPYQGSNGSLYVPHPTKVANIGDAVELEVRSYLQAPSVTWWREGVRVPSWDGQLKVEIRNFKPSDSGIYECQLSLGTVEHRAYLRVLLKKCREGFYGDHCTMKCPTCYNGGVCHDVQGICICPPGFTGNNCEDACNENHFGADCSKVCPGSSCSGILFCKPDPFGCTCAPGFKGSECKESCEPGWYGADCKQICDCANGPDSCNRYTGACSGGCSPGWRGQSCQITDACDGEPPSIRNGKILKFDQRHKSFVQYKCDQDFVLTGNSTVLCKNGKWEGQPPFCSFFDTSFFLLTHARGPDNITCHSDRHSQKISFSRVLDTGSGDGLPTNASTRRQEDAVLDLTAVNDRVRNGAYECGFQTDNTSLGIVVTLHMYGDIAFRHRSKVVDIGDTVELELYGMDRHPSELRWMHNGVPILTWDGKEKGVILAAQPSDAGIYQCYLVGYSQLQLLVRLIVRNCGKNKFGQNCDQDCPVCYNGGICHDRLGMCMCPLGFTGKNCQLACGENDVGGDCAKLCPRSDCTRHLFCKPDPYGCSCFPGFTGSWCYNPCEPGWYGADCKQTCHCANGSNSCDRYTGACSGGCSPGWSGQSCQIAVTCEGEPPSVQNGKPLKFDRNSKSMVQYECDQDFVMTGNSTVVCENGKWEGQPPVCRFFDATFTLMANWTTSHITCHSDRYFQNISFSRPFDTGSGAELPSNAATTREKEAVLDLTAVNYLVRDGAYECGFQADNSSVGIVVPYDRYHGHLLFWNITIVANPGDAVELWAHANNYVDQSSLRWRRNGVLVPAWNGQERVEISAVQPADAGFYECYQDGRRNEYQALLRLIVRKCGKNKFGENCDQECPVCYNGGICHDLLGMCMCPLGFTGKNCELACGENDVNSDCAKLCPTSDCKFNLYCKPDPYGCSCFPGFRGVWCDISCESGWYGADCKQTCHCANGPNSCDRYTGACSGGCSRGWSGQSCQIAE